ncbi:MAG TPA: tyrosine-type recombinase/integrase [Acidimicrobiales bacterium]|nr:tyrosine-type recombinase/integrase [Acidimicrobiales bacterium]
MSGSLRERSPGVWQVRVSLGRDPSTHRYRYAHATVHGGRRDAQREAARLASEAAKGRIPLTKETFGGLLTRWLDHIEARGRAPKTLVENRRMAAAITEELGTKDLQKLKASDLDAFYDRLSRRGLSPTSVRRYHAVCSAALNQGVRWGLLERSPAAHASPPSMEANEPDAPTPEEIKLLIERAEVKDPELATLLFVAATTGCRRGELCGLRWSDVDFEKCVLLVRRSVSDLPGRVEIRSTKTGHIRKMALDSATLTVLGLLRERTEARSANLGVKLNPDAYIWSSSPDGLSPLRPGSVTTRFIALRNDLGLKHIRLHHLRHFAATVMLAGGVDVRTVAGRLGHSRPTLTLQTYAHVMDATDRQAAEVVGGSISRTRSADNEVRG